tara:strand:+ start:251 stop:430 length:180 start_codon:yes stop_codon:yes gene_type:complete
MNQQQLIPMPEDYQALFSQNPMAAEQMKTIILARMLAEAEAKLAEKAEDEISEKAKKVA